MRPVRSDGVWVARPVAASRSGRIFVNCNRHTPGATCVPLHGGHGPAEAVDYNTGHHVPTSATARRAVVRRPAAPCAVRPDRQASAESPRLRRLANDHQPAPVFRRQISRLRPLPARGRRRGRHSQPGHREGAARARRRSPRPRSAGECEEGPPPEARSVTIAFSADSRTVVFSTFPPKAAIDQARKDKKPAPKEGMVIVDLASGKAHPHRPC